MMDEQFEFPKNLHVTKTEGEGVVVDQSELPSWSFVHFINNPDMFEADEDPGEMKEGRETELVEEFKKILADVKKGSYKSLHHELSGKYKGEEMEYLRIFLISSAESLDELKDVLYGIELKGTSREKLYDWEELCGLIDSAKLTRFNLSNIPRTFNLRKKVGELLV